MSRIDIENILIHQGFQKMDEINWWYKHNNQIHIDVAEKLIELDIAIKNHKQALGGEEK
jgi:hypothetical protein